MKIVILAAGIASRLRPLTNDTPKCLLKAGDKSILHMAIENLVETGNPEIIIVTGYLEQKIRMYIGEHFPQLKVKYIHNELYESTNNIYSLWLTKDSVLGDDMIMMDSDIVFDKRIISSLTGSDYLGCLALIKHELTDEEIKVKTDQAGCVIDISKEVKPSEAAGESIGIELFRKDKLPELFSILDRKVMIENDVNVFYETAFCELSGLYAVDVTGYFCMEIDTAEDLAEAGRLLQLNQKSVIS